MQYARFFAMIATSTVLMLGLMYLNTYLLGHIFWSETRAYMAALMGSAMAIVMLAFMHSMYPSRALNAVIFGLSILVFAVSLWLVRSQVTVQDRSYMRAMIPHHSIAIMTSSRAEIADPRVRKLADEIVYAQDKEIAEMRYLIADISANGISAPLNPTPETNTISSAEEALATEVRGTIDPEFLAEARIAELFPDGETCRFSYTSASPPVLVTGAGGDEGIALMQISGDLVRMESDGAGNAYSAGPLTAKLRSTEDGDLHDLTVSAGTSYEAGFRGTYNC